MNKGYNHKENCICKLCIGKTSFKKGFDKRRTNGFQKGNKLFVGKNNHMFGKKRSCSWTSERNKKQVGELNPFYGKHHTEESKFKQIISKIRNNKYKFNPTEKYYLDLKMKFKSNWEANMARIFNFLELTWYYEPQIFKLKSSFYCPDFYIKDWNCFIEVKGYMYPKSLQKINEFKEKYPIEIISSKEYKSWCNDFPLQIKELSKGEKNDKI